MNTIDTNDSPPPMRTMNTSDNRVYGISVRLNPSLSLHDLAGVFGITGRDLVIGLNQVMNQYGIIVYVIDEQDRNIVVFDAGITPDQERPSPETYDYLREIRWELNNDEIKNLGPYWLTIGYPNEPPYENNGD